VPFVYSWTYHSGGHCGGGVVHGRDVAAVMPVRELFGMLASALAQGLFGPWRPSATLDVSDAAAVEEDPIVRPGRSSALTRFLPYFEH